MSSPKGYSRIQISLHWLVGALIVAQYALHDPIVEAWRATLKGTEIAFDPLVAQHVFTGIAVLALVLWRLVLRLTRGVPDLPEKEPAYMKLAAHVTHWTLYALMILMPVTGMAAWFGGVEGMANLHEILKVPMLLLVVLHFAAALFHQLVLKTGLMNRMKSADSN